MKHKSRHSRRTGRTSRTPTASHLWSSFKKNNLLDDRREYSVDDFSSSYPGLPKKEAKKLYGKFRKWEDEK